jgi:hypothetical protein
MCIFAGLVSWGYYPIASSGKIHSGFPVDALILDWESFIVKV